jgi:integrase
MYGINSIGKVGTMTVKKHKNEKWYCKFTIRGVTKHLLCAGATTEKEALEIENAFKYKLQQQLNGIVPKDQKNVYFNRLKELYIKHAKTNHKKYRNQVYYLNSLEKYFNNGKPVNSIKPEDIQKYIEYLRNSGKRGKRKNSSINRFLEILSKMYNLAIDNGELTENPLMKVPKLKEDNHRIRFLNDDNNEEKRLFNSININAPYLKTLVITALQTGMRKGEILNMQWCNIDFNNRIIHILDTKSGDSREIPISDILYDVLKSIPKVSEYVFINPLTDLPYTDFKKSWHKVLNAAKIEGFCFHDLRHTFATRMVIAGVDFLTLMEILGHKDIKTTMRYAHVVPGRKMEAIKKLATYNKLYTTSTTHASGC